MKILTISIAAYNQEKYLDRCIKSLIIPSIDDLEIFIVNDGSKDKTSAIAHKWAKEYPNSITSIDKENGHTGSCHNITMKIATAKYYRILDSDDFYDSAALELFVNKLKSTDVDMVITTHVICHKKSNERIEPGNEIQNKEMLISGVDFTKYNLYQCFGMHGTTYKTSLIGGGKVCLTEGVAEADAEYAYFPFRYCNTILCLDMPVYMYQADNEGVHQSALVSENRKEQVFKVAKRIFDDYITNQSGNYNIRNAQRINVSRTLMGYYGMYICFFQNNPVDDQRISIIDIKLLNSDADLYEKLNEVHRLKWHFIKRYRTTGHTQVKIIKFLDIVNRLKNKLL